MLSLPSLTPVIACATCTGDPNSATMVAANAAIFVMLFCLLLLGGIGAAVVRHFARADKQHLKDIEEMGL